MKKEYGMKTAMKMTRFGIRVAMIAFLSSAFSVFVACASESMPENPADVPSVLTLKYSAGGAYDLVVNGTVCPRDGLLSWSTAEAATYTVQCSGAPAGKTFLKFVAVAHEPASLSGDIYENPVKVFVDHNSIILYPVFSP